MVPVRLSVVILPDRPWEEAAHRWRRAEDLGFDQAWTYDHLTWRSFRDRAWFGAVPTLAAAALATSRMRVGFLVASPNFRHPVSFAKELVTLDDISGGRLTVGIGAGGAGWDATMFGTDEWSPTERADRFEEFVELTDRLLREPEVTHRGLHYSAVEARTYPGCVQHPRVPLAIAATGPRGMRLAARFGDTWVTTGDRTASEPLDRAAGIRGVADQIGWLEAACEAEGRDSASLRRLVVLGPSLDQGLGSVEDFTATVEGYTAVGVTDLAVHWPREDPPYDVDPEVFEAAVSLVLAREAGE